MDNAIFALVRNEAHPMSEDGFEVRVVGVEKRLDGHELLCAERFNTVNHKVDRLNISAVSLLVAICGWALVQLYNDKTHERETKQVAAQAASLAVEKANAPAKQ
jgi:hypothetical protein